MNKKNIIDKIKEKYHLKFFHLDELIKEINSSDIDLLKNILLYNKNYKGKRIRIILLFLFYDLFSTEEKEWVDQKLINSALSIEFIHNATLFHDDVIDENDEYRRGKKPINMLWHNKLCILSGDFLLAKSFEKITEICDFEISQILSHTSSQIIEGEIYQMFINQNENQNEFDFNKYEEVIKKKTAILFSTSVKIGSLISAKNLNIDIKNILFHIEDLGLNLGILFQIIDDILDYFGSKEKFEKKIGTDYFEKKMTLPSFLLMKKLENKELFDEIWSFNRIEKDFISKKFNIFLDHLNLYEIKNQCIKYILEYKSKIIKNLDMIENEYFKLNIFNNKKYYDFKQNINEILEFFIDRQI